METLQMIGIDTGMTLVGTVIGGLWAGFKTSEQYQRLQQRRYRKALLALESGVERTYQNYVKAIKAGRADGRLSEDEKKRARAMARAQAIATAKETGLDLLKVIGKDFVDVWISRIVTRRKG